MKFYLFAKIQVCNFEMFTYKNTKGKRAVCCFNAHGKKSTY